MSTTMNQSENNLSINLLKVITFVTSICSNVIAATNDTGNQDTFDDHYFAILRALEHQISRSTERRQQLDPVVEPNLAVTTVEVDLQKALYLGLSLAVRQNMGVNGNKLRPSDVMIYYEGADEIGDIRTSIALPISLFDNTNSGENTVFYV